MTTGASDQNEPRRPGGARTLRRQAAGQALQRIPDDGPGGLVERIQAGDHVAGAALYRRHSPQIRQYLRAAVKDHHEADDLTQQVFTAVFDHIHRYRDRGLPFEHWLFAIASNTARKHARSAGRATLTDPTLLEAEQEHDALRRAPHASEPTNAGFQALTQPLNTTQRQILLLIYAFDMTHAQAATVLGRTPAAVRKAHTRGLANLTSRTPRFGL